MDEVPGIPQTPRKRGRRSKLTPELIEQIAQDVGIGVPVKDACVRAGIGTSTYHRWRERAETARSGISRDFRESLARGEANLLTLNLVTVRKAANDGDWRAAAWLLARRFPDSFGAKLEHSGAVKVTPPIRKRMTIINLVPTESGDRPADAPNHPAPASNGHDDEAGQGA